MLLYFIADLARQGELQAALAKAPVEAMQRSRLSREEQEVFESGDPERIADAVKQNVLSLAEQPLSPQPLWPGRRIRVLGVEPNTAASGSEKVSATVRGVFFPADASCSLVASDGSRIACQVSNLVAGQNSSLQIQFSLVGASPGAYACEVAGTAGPSQSNTLLQGFEVT